MFELLSWLVYCCLHSLWLGGLVSALVLLLSLSLPISVHGKYWLYLTGYFLLILAVPVVMIFSWEDGLIHRNRPQLDVSWEKQGPRESETRFEQPLLAGSASREVSRDVQRFPQPLSVSASIEQEERSIGDERLKAPMESGLVSWVGISRVSEWFQGNGHFYWSRFVVLVAFCYTVGFVLMVSRLIVMVGGMGRLKSGSSLIDSAQLLSRFEDLSKGIGLSRQPLLKLAERLETPCVFGILKPVVLLPPSLLSGLSASELDSILLHELAHIRRYDPLVVWFQRVTETVLFFNPMVWLISRRLEVLREQCCDDLVLNSGVDSMEYAKGLCKVAQFSSGIDKTSLACAADGEKPGDLLIRVRRILGEGSGSCFRVSAKSVAFLMASLLFAGVILPAVAKEASHNTIEETVDKSESLDPKIDSNSHTKQEKDNLFELEVVSEDGKTVAGAVVRYGQDYRKKWITAETDSQGLVTLHIKDISSRYTYAQVYALSKSEKLLGIGVLEREELRKGKSRLVAHKAQEVAVSVKKDGRAVRGAELALPMQGYWSEGETDRNGAGILWIQKRNQKQVKNLMVLHPEKGMGVGAIEKGKANVNLFPSTEVTILAQDQFGKPASKVPLTFRFRTEGNVDFMTSRFKDGWVKTNEEGYVVIPAFPTDYSSLFTCYASDPKNFSSGSPANAKFMGHGKPHKLQLERLPFRKPIYGFVTYKGKPVRDEVDVYAFERDVPGERTRGSRRLQVTNADRDGRFELPVNPKGECEIYAYSDKWYGKLVEIPANSYNKVGGKRLEIKLKKTIPLTVRVTHGKNKKPAEGVLVNVSVGRPGVLSSVGFRRTSRASSYRTTDQTGELTFGMPPGSVDVSVYKSPWRRGKNVRISEGKKNLVEFHTESFGCRNLTGKITAPKGVPVKDAIVKLGTAWERDRVKIDHNGKYLVRQYPRAEVVVSAMTADKKYAAIGLFGKVDRKIPNLKLRKAARVVGRLVDKEGNPMAGVLLTQYVEKRHLFLAKIDTCSYRDVRTAEDGTFLFEGLDPSYPHQIAVKQNGYRFLTFRKKPYKPGETTDVGDLIYR